MYYTTSCRLSVYLVYNTKIHEKNDVRMQQNAVVRTLEDYMYVLCMFGGRYQHDISHTYSSVVSEWSHGSRFPYSNVCNDCWWSLWCLATLRNTKLCCCAVCVIFWNVFVQHVRTLVCSLLVDERVAVFDGIIHACIFVTHEYVYVNCIYKEGLHSSPLLPPGEHLSISM